MQFALPAAEDSRTIDIAPWLAAAFLPAIVAVALICLVRGERAESFRREAATSSIAREPPPVEVCLSLDGSVSVGDRVIAVEALKAELKRELARRRDSIRAAGFDPATVLVIVRAEAEVATDRVQRFIALAQEVSYQRFVLRPSQTKHPAGAPR